MSVVIGVVNQKGGVGKTTTSINIAAGLGTLGKKILLIDFDPQGNSTTGFGIKKKTLDISTYDIIMGNARPQEAIIKTRYKNVDIIPATNQLCEAELQLADVEQRNHQLRKIILQVIQIQIKMSSFFYALKVRLMLLHLRLLVVV